MFDQNVIAIDGPSGSGKSTVAKIISEKLNFLYIDTGSMFRALALGLLKLEINLEDEFEIKNNLEQISFEYVGKKDCLIRLGGENVTDEIREHYVSDAASKISQFACVREQLKVYQRKLAEKSVCVLEGRDIGTVVFPRAKLKIFLTASNNVRAERRFEDLKKRGTLGDLTKEQILKDIVERDHRDSNRDIAPLKPADDAKILNSDNLSIDEVVSEIATYSKDIF
jgi:cytidylate kinase